MKKVLSIAGSDCSGGAGIQADLKTFSAHGVFGMSVIVSVVAENTSRVIDIQDITPDMIEKQIDAVFEDIEVDAVKIGICECMDRQPAGAVSFITAASEKAIPSLLGMYGWFCTFRGNQFTRSNPRGKRRIRNTAYSRK